MGESSLTPNVFKCSNNDQSGGEVIDLRATGVLKEPIPSEVSNNPQVKKILLFHQSVHKLLENSIGNLGHHVSISIFDECEDDNPASKRFEYNKCLWKTCQLQTDQHGLICLFQVLFQDPFFPSSKRELRRHTLRHYETGVIDHLDRDTVNNLDELIIASGEPGDTHTVNVGDNEYVGKQFIECFPEISF